MSFGQKPAAWAKPPGGAQNQQLNQNIFASQLGLTGQPFGAMPAMSLNSSLNALVNQAAFTNMSNMNNVLAQAQAAQRLLPQNVSQQQSRQASSPPQSRNQRTFIGTVTKLMETYGFVDEDVFFQTNVIRGAMPRVGDRVMVEAAFNPAMPFKWNAYRIQLPQQQESAQIMPQAAHQQFRNNNSSSGSRWQSERREEAVQRPSFQDRGHRAQAVRRQPSPSAARRSPMRKSPLRKASPLLLRPKPSESFLKRDRERTPVRESRDRTRTHSPAVSVVTNSKREDSPPRRRQRVTARYRCYKPKILVSSGELKYIDLHKRYSNLYIPSDFIRCEMSWLKSIQLDNAFQIAPHPITFNIVHKDVDVPLDEGEVLPQEQPADADNRFIVKVLLLSHVGLSALRQKIYGLLPDGSIDETVEAQSLFKNLQFLVGVKGKNDFMAIGGAWSSSLDGENPSDPQTQINTAIRTTRALTGVDLSSCSKWYKMVDLHYYRLERNRIDNVVLMLPDTNTAPALMPPSEEAFQALEERLKAQLAQKLAAIDAEPFVSPVEADAAAATSPTAGLNKNTSSSANANDASFNSSLSTEKVVNGVGSGDEMKVVDQSKDVLEAGGDAASVPSITAVDAASAAGDNTGVVSQESSTGVAAAASAEASTASPVVAASSEVSQSSECSNLAALLQEVKVMKVVELRAQLESRGLDSKGVKNVLQQRLQEALEKEGAKIITPVPKEQPNVVVKEEIMDTSHGSASGADTATVEASAPAPAAVVPSAEQIAAEKEKQEKEQKAREKFEKEKKERKTALERHYVLPKDPSIFVYPSKTARNGKFECKIVTLSSLLDYRADDSKESSFEVFLFAEAFREALDRTNAFTVYHAVEGALDREAERQRREAALTEVLEKDKEVAEDSSDDIVVLESEADKEKKKAASAGGGKDAKKADPRFSFKAVVANADIFAAFAYFDENMCGHIEERDLEDILCATGIDLSRSELQKLVKKLSNRDRINYRNITDKWIDNEGNTKYTSGLAPDAKDPSALIKGHYTADKESSSTSAMLGSTPDVTDTGIVFYRGSVLNIPRTMEQHNVVEKERVALTIKTEELDLQLKNVKKQRDHLSKSKHRLEDDLDRYKKKLYEAEKCLKASQDDLSLAKSALQDCKRYGERLITLVDKTCPPSKKKEEVKEKKERKDGSVAASNAEKDKDNQQESPELGENGNVIGEDIVLTEEVDGDGEPNEDEPMETAGEESRSKAVEVDSGATEEAPNAEQEKPEEGAPIV